MMIEPFAEVDGVLFVAAPPPKRTVNLFARDLSMLARMTGKRVLAEFKQHTLDVTPGMTAAAVHDQWWQKQLPFEKL